MILPAFGVTVGDMAQLVDQGCTLVDTTCGSVLNVWKNVVRYAQDGFTAVIHGKVNHEETRATASQALKYPGGHYLVVLDRDRSADRLRLHPRTAATRRRSSRASATPSRPGFDPDRDLAAHRLRQPDDDADERSRWRSARCSGAAMRERYGEAELAAPLPRLRHDLQRHAGAAGRRPRAPRRASALDLMVVIGGYNSSNTCNLARICAERVPTFHIADPDCLVSADEVRHRPVGAPSTTVQPARRSRRDWLPGTDPLAIGLTAGASTPNNIVGEVIERLARFAAS